MTATREKFFPVYSEGAGQWTSSDGGNEPVEWFSPFPTEPVTPSGQAMETVEDSLPTVEEFAEDEGIRLAIEKVFQVAEGTFGQAAATDIEPRVERDEVLGGVHLVLEVPVHGLQRAQYKQLRRRFDEGVRNALTPDQLGRVVWASHLDA